MEQNLKHDLNVLNRAIVAVMNASLLQKIHLAERAVDALVMVVNNQSDALIAMDRRIVELERRDHG